MSSCPLHHVAMIMDGNGRWAEKKGVSVTAGHREGVNALREVLSTCQRADVKVLTLFAFSSENWQRPKKEVDALMRLFSRFLDKEVDELCEQGVKLQFIGRRDRFSKTLTQKITSAEQVTAANRSFYLNMAVDYGGQWDLTQAVKTIALSVLDKEYPIETIDESLLAQHLSLSSFAHPDLLIRTGGEHRLSNFLLWQLAYTELYFTDVLWPDFDAKQCQLAFDAFYSRERRFGSRNQHVKM